jgi:hypothetical protein
MKLKNIKLSCEKLKHTNPKTYYSFELFGLQIINTSQVWSINFTIFNIFMQLRYSKQYE